MKPVLLLLALFFVSSVSPSAFAEDPRMNELPMYGGQHNPTVEPNKEASADAAALGWKLLGRGDLSTAMKRFNQAWMFDRKNADAFWGMGTIMGRRAAKEAQPEKNLTESIQLLTTAHDLRPTDGRITADLAFSHTVHGYYLTTRGQDGKPQYEKAETLFTEAYKSAPQHPPLTANWAVLKFYTGDYAAAKKLITEAQGLGYKPDSGFLKELEEKTK